MDASNYPEFSSNNENSHINKKPSKIAIDGPAASGKSTIAKLIADELGYLLFDTGVMYRAVTWAAIQRGVDLADEFLVTGLANTIRIEVFPPSQEDGRVSDIFADGKDITWKIRKPEVDVNVSQVSAYQGVRNALTKQQRRIGEQGKIVMVGRDIGTIVLPDADLKIFLDASAEVRARRRHLENLGRDDCLSYESILETLRKRDKIDSTREIAPLRAADDAIVINTDGLDIDQVFYQSKKIISRWRKS